MPIKYLCFLSILPSMLVQNTLLAQPIRSVTYVPAVTHEGFFPDEHFGSSLDAIDFDGDGVNEILVGAPGFFAQPNGVGRFSIVSSVQDELIFIEFGFEDDLNRVNNFGASVASIGDIDGDGLSDVVVGQPFSSDPDSFDSPLGSALVYTSAEGEVAQIQSGLSGSDAGFFGAVVDGVGDVNLDGVNDYIVGNPDAERVQVFSGLTGQVIYNFNGSSAGGFGFGFAVSGLGDVNFDQVPDFAISDLVSEQIRIISGINGSLVAVAVASGPPIQGGGAIGTFVGAAGDIDGDGANDVLAGEVVLTAGITQDILSVFSGRTGERLQFFVGNLGERDLFGTSADSLGDINSDGFVDFVVGAPGSSINGEGSGSVHVVSGDGSGSLVVLNGDDLNDQFGGAVRSLGDVNGDGVADFVVGAPFSDRFGSDFGTVGYVRVFTSRVLGVVGDFDFDGDVDLADLDRYHGNIGEDAVGALLALDLDGDGVVGSSDFQLHYSALVETSNGFTGTFAGDANLDGTVDVLNDAFVFVANLGRPVESWSDGDFSGDGFVNVLDDGFLLIPNIGNRNDGGLF